MDLEFERSTGMNVRTDGVVGVKVIVNQHLHIIVLPDRIEYFVIMTDDQVLHFTPRHNRVVSALINQVEKT